MRRADDERFMRLAIEEAKKGVGRTHPNPAVGAVIVKAGKVIATGFHARAGTAHAEAKALLAAGAKAKGATIYVTLEPCDHFGRTPPCTQAILDHQLARVVYGSSDPNPLVNGKGVKRLRRAGLSVTASLLEAECDALNEPFFKAMRTGLPFVVAKAGATLDGKIATSTGASKWITSDASRRLAHGLRNRVDAIIVGVGTVNADDPQLTTRLPNGRDALRVVIDPTLRTAVRAKVYADENVLVVAGPRASKSKRRAFDAAKVAVLEVREKRGVLDLRQVLKALVKRGALHVLIEGGASTTASFLRAGLVDELRLFVAPTLFGHDGLTWSGALGVTIPSKAPAFRFISVEQGERDVVIVARPASA